MEEQWKLLSEIEEYKDFTELIELSSTIKDLQKKVKDLRNKILPKMQECHCSRVLDLQHKKQLTISSGKLSSRKVFDEERFKREQPELYKKYCHSECVGGVGGTLILRNMSEKAYKFYKKSEFSQYFCSNFEDK